MIDAAWHIVGGRPLRGRVRPSGSKNGALPTLAATLLLEGETVLQNVPRIGDVLTMMELLRAFGLTVEERERGELQIVNRGLTTHSAPEDLVARMRASHYLLGPVVARLGRANLPLPGGCDIGQRPMNYIISGLEALGVQAQVETGKITARASRLTGARVALNPVYRSPGATFNVLMAAATAKGTTVIENASFEPDVVVFCHFLKAAGAQIEGIGQPTLTVTGVQGLAGTGHRVNADRLEAGTFLCAAAATRGEVTVEEVTRSDLGAAADKLDEAGVELTTSTEGLRARCPGRPRGISVVTEPYPGFPTDLQPPMTTLLVCAEGESTVRESIFDRRLQYADQLARMGASMRVLDSRRLAVRGVERLHAAKVEAHNIRDGAAMVIAALSAEGESVVSGWRYVARGYEEFEGKLRSLGAQITLAGEGDG